MHIFSNIPKNFSTKGGNSRDPSSLNPDLAALWIWVWLTLFGLFELGWDFLGLFCFFFSYRKIQKLIHFLSIQRFNGRMGFIAVLWLFQPHCKGWNVPFAVAAEKIHRVLTKLGRETENNNFSLHENIQHLDSFVYSLPNVSFRSYKARGNIRINESQYFYNLERFRWESPRSPRSQQLMVETAHSDLFWFFCCLFWGFFFFFPLMLSEQKTPCKFWRAFSRMQVSVPWPGAFQRLQIN